MVTDTDLEISYLLLAKLVYEYSRQSDIPHLTPT
jgi:hypothetical protein